MDPRSRWRSCKSNKQIYDLRLGWCWMVWVQICLRMNLGPLCFPENLRATGNWTCFSASKKCTLEHLTHLHLVSKITRSRSPLPFCCCACKWSFPLPASATQSWAKHSSCTPCRLQESAWPQKNDVLKAEDVERWDPPLETHHKGVYLLKLSNTFMAFTKSK